MAFVRNLSIRVPWHDRGWDGHVCDAPLANSSCLALKLVAETGATRSKVIYAGRLSTLSRRKKPSRAYEAAQVS